MDKEEIKVIVDVVSGDRMRNKLMHCADMFESFKQLGEFSQLVVSGSPDMDIKNLTRNLKDSIEKSGMDVTFVSIRQIGPTLTNDYDRYIMPGVSAISNGHQWGIFHSILESIGYEVETDEHMRVLSVKLKW